ncbi:MAG TPA: hypothetical protein VEG38_02895 [Acidimicrobiia bacterium]|nr:hypothetical protein [Acidimicrobiia bacterium]
MRSWVRLGVVSATAVTAGLLGIGVAPVAGAAPVGTTDPGGDTVTEAVEEPFDSPPADIVATSAESRPDGIVLSLRVKQLADPLADPNWASEATIVAWTLDVNGDKKRDYVVEYAIDPETRQLAGFMYRTGSGGMIPDSCDEPKVSFNRDAGYTVQLSASCLGNPGALSYRVQTSYDTDNKNDSAETVTDTSPDADAWTGPVTVALPTGIVPLAVGSPPQPSAPAGVGSTTTTVPPAQSAPQAPADTPRESQPARSTPSMTSRSARATSGSPQASLEPAPAPAPALAHTGAPDRMARMAWFAAGIILIGSGILFGNRRPVLQPARVGPRRRISR